jgi:transposase
MPKEERAKQATFSGKRVKRGLYKTKNGILVNADINGAANVLRKYLQEVCDANKTDVKKASEPADIGYVMNPS